MMRFLRLLFLALLGLLLLVVAFANRTPVSVRLLPEDLAALTGVERSVQIPLFLVIFAGILAGLAIGLVLEWFRESKHRSAAVQHRRQAASLEREVSRLREKDPAAPKDEILSLLEAPRKAG